MISSAALRVSHLPSGSSTSTTPLQAVLRPTSRTPTPMSVNAPSPTFSSGAVSSFSRSSTIQVLQSQLSDKDEEILQLQAQVSSLRANAQTHHLLNAQTIDLMFPLPPPRPVGKPKRQFLSVVGAVTVASMKAERARLEVAKVENQTKKKELAKAKRATEAAVRKDKKESAARSLYAAPSAASGAGNAHSAAPLMVKLPERVSCVDIYQAGSHQTGSLLAARAGGLFATPAVVYFFVVVGADSGRARGRVF